MKGNQLLVVVLIMLVTFSNAVGVLSGENISDDYGSTVLFLYDGSRTDISSLVFNTLAIFPKEYKIVTVAILSPSELAKVDQYSYITVLVFHGSKDGMYFGNLKINWETVGKFINKLHFDKLIVESCYSYLVLPFLKKSIALEDVHTLEKQIDIKLARYDVSLAIANYLMEGEATHHEDVGKEIYRSVITEITKDPWNYMMLSLFPEHPLGLDIPETSGLNGPVGFFIDLIFKYLKEQGYSHIDPGFSLASSIALTGEDSLLPKEIDLALTFSWTINYDGREISLSATFELPAEQPEDSKLAALLKVGGFSVGIEGEFSASMIATLLTVNGQTTFAFQLLDFSFSFSISLEREIALIEFLIGGVPAASSAPYPFDEILKSISVKISFTVTLSIELDLVLQVHVFGVEIGFGIELNMGIDLNFVSAEVGVGSEISFSFSFSSIGNVFSVMLTVYWYVSASMAFWTGEYRQDASWGYSAGDTSHPSQKDGKQMNCDQDYDGLSDAYEQIIGTDPNLNDTDGDGLLDGYEIFNLFTDPTVVDTDGDGINDSNEEDYWLQRGLMTDIDSDGDGLINILDPDSDNDELTDGEEKNIGTSPLLVDTDGDQISDFDEVHGYQITVVINGQTIHRNVYTSPTESDTDGDGIEDYVEQSYSIDPTLKDTDDDGVSDLIELQNGWNPNVQDTDGDGLTDGNEYLYGLNPLLNDSDKDGWADAEEVNYNSNHGGILQDTDNDGLINILDPDSDNDLILDGDEVHGWQSTGYTSDPLSIDTDSDNLNDTMEYQLGCNPQNNDTDSDQLSDSSEYYGVAVSYNETWVLNGKVFTDPATNDSDSDGKSDYNEIYGSPPSDPNDDDSDDDYLADSCDPAPSDPDADDDGWLDGAEYQYWNETRGLGDTIAASNIQDSDVDNDGLNDWEEYSHYNTDPNSADTDSDNLSDYQEIQGFNVNLNGTVQTVFTDPLQSDTDKDGLNDNYEINISHTNPCKIDSDGDWLSDKSEIQNYSTDPWLVDTDGDLLSDYQELCYNTNPLSNDTDLDNLTDFQEIFGVTLDYIDSYNMNHHYIKVYCDPHVPDTDMDGIPDGIEVFNYGTNPRLKDSDFDGLNDSVEIMKYNTNPLDPDTDDDLVNDYIEIYGYQYTALCIPHPGEITKVGIGLLRLSPKLSPPPVDLFYLELKKRTDITIAQDNEGLLEMLVLKYWVRTDALQLRLNQTAQGWVTNPLNPDTDNDNVIDGYEYIIGTNPQNNDTDGDRLNDGSELDFLGGYGTDPLRADTDNDKLTDYQEVQGMLSTENKSYIFTPTDPLSNDTDKDGLSDFVEIVYYGTNATNADTDSDLISDFNEIQVYHTNPLTNDTDGDNLSDYAEINTYHTSALNNDTDGDGFTDYYEIDHSPLSPLEPDYDHDGIPDGMESYYGLHWDDSDENSNGIADGKEHDYDNDGLSDWAELYQTHSLLANIDTDGDLLNDSFEAQMWLNLGFDPKSDLDNDGSTNLWDTDSDGDEISDYNETFITGTNPGLVDTDGDLLNDSDELNYNCNATNPDSDNDGSFDGLEVYYYQSNPLDNDENDNGVVDGKERDYDNDTLSDWEELYLYHTNQLLLDSDGDNVPDNVEITTNTDPTDPNDYPIPEIVEVHYPPYANASSVITITINVIQIVPITNATLYWYYDNETTNVNSVEFSCISNKTSVSINTRTQWRLLHFWFTFKDIYSHITVSDNFTISVIETNSSTNSTPMSSASAIPPWALATIIAFAMISSMSAILWRYKKRR